MFAVLRCVEGVARGEVIAAPSSDDTSPAAVARRRSWARLLRKIFEVDPLLCPQCGVEMQVVGIPWEGRPAHLATLRDKSSGLKKKIYGALAADGAVFFFVFVKPAPPTPPLPGSRNRCRSTSCAP